MISCIAPSKLSFGDGRRANLKYYQYSSTASQIIDKIKNDLDEVGIDVDFPEVENVNTWRPKFSWARLWYASIIINLYPIHSQINYK